MICDNSTHIMLTLAHIPKFGVQRGGQSTSIPYCWWNSVNGSIKPSHAISWDTHNALLSIKPSHTISWDTHNALLIRGQCWKVIRVWYREQRLKISGLYDENCARGTHLKFRRNAHNYVTAPWQRCIIFDNNWNILCEIGLFAIVWGVSIVPQDNYHEIWWK